MSKKYYFDLKMTKHDFEKIIKELNKLKTEDVVLLQAQLKKERLKGNISTNERYQDLRQQMTDLYHRIAVLEEYLDNKSFQKNH